MRREPFWLSWWFITCIQWFLNTIMQVSGSTPLNVRDFFRLPPTTTEAIILTVCQAAVVSPSSMWAGRRLLRKEPGGSAQFYLSGVNRHTWAQWAAAGLPQHKNKNIFECLNMKPNLKQYKQYVNMAPCYYKPPWLQILTTSDIVYRVDSALNINRCNTKLFN